MKPTLGIIGAGHLGGAIYRALTKAGYPVLITDKHGSKVRALSRRAPSSLTEICQKSAAIIIAVKPQSFLKLAKELKLQRHKGLIVSIMAGITIKTLAQTLNTKKIVRAMPNLAAQANAGLTGFLAPRAITATEKKLVKNLLATFGQVLELNREEGLDALTALSGSGPAYFFYLTELLEAAALKFGFSPASARLIALQVLWGSAQILKHSSKNAAHWRAAVTSPRGTTHSALKVLNKHHWDKIFFKAVAAARARAQKLSK